ncbi:MAG: hypothetical protein JWO36_7319 [Myxococcales bacterium]|nr:hypothetical protein [Myxococcales bacterium]
MKKLLVLAVVSTVAFAGYRWNAASSAEDKGLAQDRVWIDHLPRGERDMINVFVLLTEHPIGAFQQTSAWKGGFEAFRYEANGGEVRAVYPQTGDREKFKVRATKCTENQMDYCLEIEGASRGVKRYYSRKGWEIDSRDRADAIVHGLY